MGCLFLAPHVESLVHDHQTHLVAELEQLGSRRVVRRTDGIDAHILHDFELAADGAAVNHGAESAGIVMQANAVDFHTLAIEREAFFGVKAEIAQAHGLHVGVEHGAGAGVLHIGRETVEVRRAGSPQAGIGHGQTVLHGDILAFCSLYEGGGGARHWAPLGVKKLGIHVHTPFLLEAEFGGDVERGAVVGHVGAYLLSPQGHMDVGKRAQPHVAVDAAAAVPARVGLLGVVDVHGHHVAALAEPGSEVVAERGIAVGASAETMAVDVDGGVHVGAVEVDVGVLFKLFGTHFKALSVPADAAGESSAAGAAGIVDAEVALDGPVVGQREASPR